MPEPADPLLRNARRELLFIVALWAVALVWTVGVSYALGYGRPADQIKLILGMPDWVFFGVLLPWLFCSAATLWFGLRLMADDDLGREKAEGQDAHA
jgi:hypothetical protein